MNKIVLGTVQFGTNYGINNAAGQVPFEEVCRILDIASDSGIKTIDTSSAYGVSESVLGKGLKQSGKQFNIVSKYPRTQTRVRETFEKSIQNLGVNHLYGYLEHSFEFYQEYPQSFADMMALKNEGKIQKVGFSIYNVDQLNYLYEHNVAFDIIQFPYNIFDRQFEPYMPDLDERGVEIHTRSAFLQGLFFKDTNALSEKLMPLKPYLDSLHRYCNQQGLTVEQIAFGYVLSNEHVNGALIGVDNSQQLKRNYEASCYSLDKSDIEFIKSIDIKEKYLLNPVNWK